MLFVNGPLRSSYLKYFQMCLKSAWHTIRSLENTILFWGKALFINRFELGTLSQTKSLETAIMNRYVH